MKQIVSLLVTAFVLVTCTFGLQNPQTAPITMARGFVFVDGNGNQKRDVGEKPLAGIRVSNGRQIVTTDSAGQYKIPVDSDDIIFVIKPRGYRTVLSENMLPRFYYVHKPAGSPKTFRYKGVEPTGPLPASVDFPLYAQDEPEEFKALMFGDPQPRNQQEVDWIAHDVIEDLVGTDASFGVTLGDIVFDNLDVMEPLNKTIALLGIPWYNVIGNHDINLDAPSRTLVNETFERVYGPAYYSFDYGAVHFLVIDNIDWYIDKDKGRGSYRGGIGREQLEFIKTDLSLIPENQLVVIMMHIPLNNVHDRTGLYRLIEKRPACISISGHTHHHEHVFIDGKDGWRGAKPHHHMINVTVCGSWWSGAPDERGIPHTTMADGAPNGYSILSFDGDHYRLDFRAAGKSADYQMEIDAPEVASLAGEMPDVFVNVFNGSERSKVEMRVGDSSWQPMEFSPQVDPKLKRTWDRENTLLEQAPAWRQLSKPKKSTHIWKARIPANIAAGTHRIEIKATDLWGREFTSNRIIRVEK